MHNTIYAAKSDFVFILSTVGATSHTKLLSDPKIYPPFSAVALAVYTWFQNVAVLPSKIPYAIIEMIGWLGSRVVSSLDSSAEGPGFKSQPRRCRLTVLGKLFTPIVPLFTKQRNW